MVLSLATSQGATQVGLPVGDPQFWIVTAAALCALGWLVWRMVPRRWLRKRRGTATRATLTVGGKAVTAKDKCH